MLLNKKYLANPILLEKLIWKSVFKATNRGISLYSAFPKSASNQVLELVRHANPSLRIIETKISYGFGHNYIDDAKIFGPVFNQFRKLLLYGHVPFNNHNCSIMRDLRIKSTLVSIRSLPDVVMSYSDHIDKFGYGALDYRIYNLQEGNPNWPNLTPQQKYDFVIKYIVPWYIRFVVGWMIANKEFDVGFVTFEEITSFPIDFLKCVCDFLQIDPVVSAEKVDLLKAKPANYNVGQSGRGFSELSDNQLASLEEMMSLYGTDFVRSNVGSYLLHGYGELDFGPRDVVEKYRDGILPFGMLG